MKVLIFGSNGLVGKSLTNKLNNSSKISKLFTSSRLDTDLFDIEAVHNIFKKTKPDYVINCAAKVGGILANNTFRTDFIVENLKINLNIVEVLKKYNNCSLINLGSSCIYPLNAPNPIKEEHFMTGQLETTNSPYAISKITAIELGRALNNDFGNKVINLMPTNLYGPNDNFSEKNSHVIPGLISRMHKSKINNIKSFQIWGSGKPLREFMHVNDLADAIEFLIGKQFRNDLINIGTGEEVSILNLSEQIKNIIGYKGSLNFDSSKPDGNPRKLLDSTLIYSLGWKPKIKLINGLEQTYDWYLENIDKIRK